MTVIESVIFGVVQGLTEFLPISSSGHLAVFHQLSASASDALVPMGVIAHLGTLLAVLIYFRHDLLMFTKAIVPSALSSALRKPSMLVKGIDATNEEDPRFHQRILMMIAIGSIPTAAIGLLFKDQIESAFSNVKVIGAMFLLTAAILFLTKAFRGRGKTVWHAFVLDALVIGAFQAIAIMPGISRSGATIAAALFLGFRKDFAARFSFLLSIPAIAGAFLLEFSDIAHVLNKQGVLEALFVFVSAFAVGYVAIAALLKVVGRGKLHLFGFYCLAIGIATLILL